MALKQWTQMRREASGEPGWSCATIETRTTVGWLQKMQGS